MRKTFCDKCGVEITEKDKQKMDFEFMVNNPFSSFPNSTYLELCPKHFKELKNEWKKWLK